MPSPTEITVDQLARLLGTPNAPVVIDVRIDADFNDAPTFLPCAYRHSFQDVEALVPQLYEKRVVIYCQKGKKISQGAAALLRHYGIAAETLVGGHLAWQAAGLPQLPAAKLNDANNAQGSVWVTRHRPKIDRIACPWLVRRFIDPCAKFLFVEPAEVLNVAGKFSAVAFDVAGAALTHRADGCAFDAFIDEYNLNSKPLQHMAQIIRAADTGNIALAPEAAGLLAVSLGLSRMYKDDLAQLDASMPVYDALYRWCRDATRETHAWPDNHGPHHG